jgi:hypothetical protein
VIEKHNTVYAQKPGEPDCTIDGAKIESAAHYLAKKEEFAKKSLTSQVAPTGVTSTSTASSEKPDAAPVSGVTFKQLTEKLMELNASKAEGHGREALKAFLLKHVGEGKNVPALEALHKNAELLAEVEAILSPAAAEQTDDNLFG